MYYIMWCGGVSPLEDIVCVRGVGGYITGAYIHTVII
jgi:hypothetical protein